MRNVFKGKQFDKRIIIEAVGLYCRFSLSYRDVYEILRHRGIQVNPTTIMRWVHQYGTLLGSVANLKKSKDYPKFLSIYHAALNRLSISSHGEKSKRVISLRLSLYKAETTSIPLMVVAAV